MNPWIDQGIAEIILTPQTLLTPATKEIVADVSSGGAWINRNPRQLIRTGVDGSTPGDIGNNIGIVELSPPIMIGIIGTTPPYGINLIQEVSDKWQYNSPGLVRQSQELDAVVDGKFPNNLDSN